MTCEERARCLQGNRHTFRNEVMARIEATAALEPAESIAPIGTDFATSSMSEIGSDEVSDAGFIQVDLHQPHMCADADAQPSQRHVETGPYNETDLKWLSFITTVAALRVFIWDYGEGGLFARRREPKYRFELRFLLTKGSYLELSNHGYDSLQIRARQNKVCQYGTRTTLMFAITAS